jgi:hypothetical protein
MPWYPKATRKPAGLAVEENAEPFDVVVRWCSSTEPSMANAALDDIPTLFVRKTGHVEQYRSAVGRLVVVGTQGTDPQVEPPAKQKAAVEDVLAWLQEQWSSTEGIGNPREGKVAELAEALTPEQDLIPLCFLHGPDGADDGELRWSIRAMAKRFPGREVWIVGYCPPWVDRDKVRVLEVPTAGRPAKWSKHDQLNQALRFACAQIPGRFVVCHDDHFPVTAGASLAPVHRGVGSLPGCVERLEAARPKDAWTKNHRATLDHLVALGHDPATLASYEIHRPMLVEGQALAAMLAAAPSHPEPAVLYKTLYGNLANVGGTELADHKARGEDEPIPDGADWVSTNPTSWKKGEIGRQLREMFPDPSPYELAAPAKPQPAPVAPAGEALSPDTAPGKRDGGKGQITRAQSWLNALGYECGKPPGHYGRKTRLAVAAFHADHGHQADGRFTSETFALLQAKVAEAKAAGTAKILHPHQAKGLSSRAAGEHLERLARAVPAGQAIVEIGVFHGRTLLYLAKGSAEGNGAPVHGVDPWDLPGERYPSAWAAEKRHRSTFTLTETRETCHANIRNATFLGHVHITTHRAFSTEFAAEWDGPKIGLLHIDGNHNYPDALHDFEAWRPHLAPDAVVVWDDWDDKHPGVQQSVAELVLRGELTPPQSAPGAERLAVTRTITAEEAERGMHAGVRPVPEAG